MVITGGAAMVAGFEWRLGLAKERGERDDRMEFVCLCCVCVQENTRDGFCNLLLFILFVSFLLLGQ